MNTSGSVCSWFARGSVGAACPFLCVCSAVGMWRYPTNCVYLALGAFPVVDCVPPADLTHLGQSCWYIVRLPLGTQGYPFVPSVWVLKCCLVKSVHQSTERGTSESFD